MASPALKRRRLKKEDSATSQVQDDASLMLAASGRVALAEDFVSGTWIAKFAAENLAGFKTLLGAGETQGPLGHGPGRLTLTWATACSGSEGAYFVVKALNKAFEAANMDVVLTHKFSCEADKKKRAWIKSVLAEAGDSHSTCLFQDIQGLHAPEAWCDVHKGRPCEVPTVDVLILGTSCKDLSRANASVDKKKLVLTETTSKGGSAQIYRGFIGYVASHRPLLVIYENVDAIDDKVSASQETNLGVLMREMREEGYEGQKVMTDAQEFGLPCRRRRLYVFFVLQRPPKIQWKRKAIGQVFASFRNLVSSCMRSPPCATECLLGPDSAQAWVVEDALQEHTKAAEEAAKKKAQPNTGWVTKHMEYAEQLGVRWAGPVESDLSSNEWFWSLTKREGDALQLSRVAGPQSEFRNLSQSLGRVHGNTLQPKTGKHIAPTMLPGQVLWTESQKRLVTGPEALNFQGFPALPFVEPLHAANRLEFSHNFMTDLAGNAMALPVLLAILQAGLASIYLEPDKNVEMDSCETDQEGQEEEDVAIAVAALARLGQ